MEINTHTLISGKPYPGTAEQSPDRRSVKKPESATDDGGKRSRQGTNPATASVLIDVREVTRVQETEDAQELQPVTHTVRPSLKVQAFQQIANNGNNYRAIDIYV